MNYNIELHVHVVSKRSTNTSYVEKLQSLACTIRVSIAFEVERRAGGIHRGLAAAERQAQGAVPARRVAIVDVAVRAHARRVERSET